MSKCELSLKVLQIASIFQITHFTYILGELSISEFSDPYLITHLLKMSNCLLSQKSIADSQYFSNNSFTYILEIFHMLKFFYELLK